MITITLPYQTEESLFDGTDGLDRSKLDIPASIANYEAGWKARVEETYPEATVAYGTRKAPLFHLDARASDPDGHNDADSAADEAVIQEIGEELFNDGNLWMVTREESVTAQVLPATGCGFQINVYACDDAALRTIVAALKDSGVLVYEDDREGCAAGCLFVDSAHVGESVRIINGLGFATDEDIDED